MQPAAATGPRAGTTERDHRQHVVEQRDHAHIDRPGRQPGIAVGVLHEGQPHDRHVAAKHTLHEHALVAHLRHEAPCVQLCPQVQQQRRADTRSQHDGFLAVTDLAAHQLMEQQARQPVVEDQPRRFRRKGGVHLPRAAHHHAKAQQQHAGQGHAHGEQGGIEQRFHRGNTRLSAVAPSADPPP